MREYLKFYIDGQWVDPLQPNAFDVENPATEQVSGKISLGSAADVDVAVRAARRAFASWSQTTREQRLDLLQAILAEYQKRADDLAEAITDEIGAPPSLAAGPQVFLGIGHLTTAIDALKNFSFEEQKGESLIAKEPIGVCGLITPWNWPINQVAVKVYPALATGCTVVLKPSEVAPFSPYIFAEILDAAGVPAGVFNLVNGDGPGVGEALASHPDIDLVSFTGLDPRRHRGGQARGPDREAGDPGTRRQEPQHRARRQRLCHERQRRRGQYDAELGPELQRAHAHAGSEIPYGRGGFHRTRGGREGHRG